MTLGIALGYWLYYQQRNQALHARSNVVNNIRQVGLGFRENRNDLRQDLPGLVVTNASLTNKTK